MEFDLPKHLAELARHLRDVGVLPTRRLNFDEATEASYDLCRALTTPDSAQRTLLTAEALEDLARGLGHGDVSPGGRRAVDTPIDSARGGKADLAQPISDDLSALQIPCPKCSQWELVAKGTRYPLAAYCRACGETSQLK